MNSHRAWSTCQNSISVTRPGLRASVSAESRSVHAAASSPSGRMRTPTRRAPVSITPWNTKPRAVMVGVTATGRSPGSTAMDTARSETGKTAAPSTGRTNGLKTGSPEPGLRF